MDLHDKIKNTRENAKVSRKEIADYLCVTVAHIGHIENGKRTIMPHMLAAISKYLKVPIEYYLNDEYETLEEFRQDKNVEMILENRGKYGEYLKAIDMAIVNEISPDDFQEFLEFMKKFKKRS